MSSNLEQTVIGKLRELPPEKQRAVLEFVETLLQPSPPEAGGSVTSRKSLWEEIEEIVQEVPEETWDQIPADGAEQHDHYLYGAPKK